jgi:rare lipoprotein A
MMAGNKERFDERNPNIAAHKTLPLGTKIRVTNLENGMVTIVTVKDRGPYKKKRVLDMSKAAGEKIGITEKNGIALVKIEVV